MLTHLLLVVTITLASTSALIAPSPNVFRSLNVRLQDTTKTGEVAATTTMDPFDTYQINTPSQALAIREIVVGSGDAVATGDLISVEYSGKLMSNGKQFDSGSFTFQYGEPKRVMAGWTQGLEGIKVGGKRQLRIPPRLAYGAKGAGDVIPPNADLEFEVTVLEKKQGPITEFIYKVGLGLNKKTAGLIFFLGFLALSPQIDAYIAQINK